MHSTSFTEHNARFDWSLSKRQQAIVGVLLNWSLRVWYGPHKLLYGKERFWVKHRQQFWGLVVGLSLLAVGEVFAAASGRFQYKPVWMAAVGFLGAETVIFYLWCIVSSIHDAAWGVACFLDDIPRWLHAASAARSAWEAWEEDTPPSPASGDDGGVIAESPLFLEQEEIV